MAREEAQRASPGGLVLEYYGWLATRVPPRLLLGTAARRAIRAARSRLVPRPVAPARDEVLAGFGCESLAELAALLGRGARGLVTAERDGIGRALARWFPGEAERLVTRGDAILDGRLTVFGHDVPVTRPGGGTDWQLDPVHGGRFAAWAASDELPDVPGCDVKMAWAVGRGDQWVALACAAHADPPRGDLYAEAYATSVRDFLAQNPVGRGAHWVCAMEAALRAVCLGQAHALLTGRAALTDPGYALDAARLAIATGRFVLANLEDASAVPNNHLAADWLGLLACAALVPEWPEAARWRALGASGLAREILRQTHADGTSFEGSVPYHRLALEIFTAGGLYCRMARHPLGGAFWRRLGAMYHAARTLLSRSGTLPQIGDNDSGRVLAFRERAPLDGSYLPPLGAAVCGEAALKVEPGAAGAEEVLWLLGANAAERVARARPGRPARSAAFAAGGFHVLRRRGVEIFVSCGRNGQSGIGGHSHNDKLAFELHVGRRLAICDPGSPCYASDPETRDAFRSTRAHATVVVDGEEQAPLLPGRPFALPDAASATLLLLESTDRHERFVGEHRGYAALGVVHRRSITLSDGGALVVDRLSGGGRHEIGVRFPLPGPEARIRPLTAAERAAAAALWDADAGIGPAALDAEHAIELGPEAAPHAVLAVAAPSQLSAELARSTSSPGYGQTAPARCAVFAGRVECPATVVTVVLPLASGEGPSRRTERNER
jgi:hypothetical protein